MNFSEPEWGGLLMCCWEMIDLFWGEKCGRVFVWIEKEDGYWWWYGRGGHGGWTERRECGAIIWYMNDEEFSV